MLNRLRMVLAATGVGLATLMWPQTSAWANSEQCPEGSFCVWENPDFSGHFAYFNNGAKDLTKPIGGFVFNDKISSTWNRSRYRACVYKDINYHSNPPSYADPQQPHGYPLNSSWDNQMSSLRLDTLNTGC